MKHLQKLNSYWYWKEFLDQYQSGARVNTEVKYFNTTTALRFVASLVFSYPKILTEIPTANDLKRRKNVGKSRHGMPPSTQLPSISGTDSKLGH